MRIQYEYGADPVPVRELYFDLYCMLQPRDSTGNRVNVCVLQLLGYLYCCCQREGYRGQTGTGQDRLERPLVFLCPLQDTRRAVAEGEGD